ncbi:MAG: aminoglycoside phosphotransferase family protein [Steroidobacteraceae bacterium]
MMDVNLIATLASRWPGLDAAHATLLEGGTINRTWAVVAGEDRLVVHDRRANMLRGEGDRLRELRLHGLAARYGFAPEILASFEAGAVLVTRYVAAPVWDGSTMSPDVLTTLVGRLVALRRVAPPPGPAFNPAEDIRGYCESLTELTGRNPLEEFPRLQRLAERERHAPHSVRTNCILHNDLHSANVLLCDPLQLLDWEYATVGDPLHDLASLLAAQPSLTRHVELILATAQLDPAAGRSELLELACLHGILADLWFAAAAGEAGAARRLAGEKLHERLTMLASVDRQG